MIYVVCTTRVYAAHTCVNLTTHCVGTLPPSSTLALETQGFCIIFLNEEVLYYLEISKCICNLASVVSCLRKVCFSPGELDLVL